MTPSTLANLYLVMESSDHPGIEYCLLGEMANVSMTHYHKNKLTRVNADILMHERAIPLTTKSYEVHSPADRKTCAIDLNKVDISKELNMLSAAVVNKSRQPKIERVIFNDPATIVFWSDGDKTVVKAVNEAYDPEKGLAMAITKKLLGHNKGNYYNELKKWLPSNEKEVADNDEPD